MLAIEIIKLLKKLKNCINNNYPLSPNDIDLLDTYMTAAVISSDVKFLPIKLLFDDIFENSDFQLPMYLMLDKKMQEMLYVIQKRKELETSQLIIDNPSLEIDEKYELSIDNEVKVKKELSVVEKKSNDDQKRGRPKTSK